MKAAVLTTLLWGFLTLGSPDARAQIHGPYFGSNPYWDAQYQQYLHYENYLQWQQYLDYLRSVDPYYDLHLIHYQLYLAPYNPYQAYWPCCYAPRVRLHPGRWVPYGMRTITPPARKGPRIGR